MNGNNRLFASGPFWYAQNMLVNALNMSVANEKGLKRDSPECRKYR